MKDPTGRAVRYVGVQCEVGAEVPQRVISRATMTEVGEKTLREIVIDNMGTLARGDPDEAQQYMELTIAAMIHDLSRGVDWDRVSQYFVASHRVLPNHHGMPNRFAGQRLRTARNRILHDVPIEAKPKKQRIEDTLSNDKSLSAMSHNHVHPLMTLDSASSISTQLNDAKTACIFSQVWRTFCVYAQNLALLAGMTSFCGAGLPGVAQRRHCRAPLGPTLRPKMARTPRS
eukprot:SAG31_NODE_3750_length_3923_cov_7.559100_2_plen_230_part_00